MTTDLHRYFDPLDYEVSGFFSSTNHSMWDAADRLALPPEARVGARGYPPYVELKNGSPEIYADRHGLRWITFNAVAHGANLYMTAPGCRRDRPAVLLWRKE